MKPSTINEDRYGRNEMPDLFPLNEMTNTTAQIGCQPSMKEPLQTLKLHILCTCNVE